MFVLGFRRNRVEVSGQNERTFRQRSGVIADEFGLALTGGHELRVGVYVEHIHRRAHDIEADVQKIVKDAGHDAEKMKKEKLAGKDIDKLVKEFLTVSE